MTEAERTTAQHEAGHAAAALTQGLPVTAVSRTSPDPRRYLGYTRFPLAAGQPLPTWPLSDNNGTDEKLLKIFCEYLGLDARGYDHLITEMWQLSCTKRFERLFTVLTTWFEHRRTLD